MADLGPYQKLRVLINKKGGGLENVPETTPEEQEAIEKEYFEDVASGVAGAVSPVKKIPVNLPSNLEPINPLASKGLFQKVKDVLKKAPKEEVKLPKPTIDMPIEQIKQEHNLLWEVAPNSDEAKRATEILNKKLDFEARKKAQGL